MTRHSDSFHTLHRRRELSEAREAQLLEATGNERKFLAEKSKMQKDLEKRTAEIRRLAKQEMQNGLDADTLKVIGTSERRFF